MEEKTRFFGLVAGPKFSEYHSKVDNILSRLERGEEITVAQADVELKKARLEYDEALKNDN